MKCFVPSCNNLSDFQNRRKRNNVVKVTFHCFAKDSDSRTLWSDILGIRASVIPEKASICLIHFEETSFYTKGSHVRSRLAQQPRQHRDVSEPPERCLMQDPQPARSCLDGLWTVAGASLEGLIYKTTRLRDA